MIQSTEGSHQSMFRREDENVLSMYLKEINRIPLLTRDEGRSSPDAPAAAKKLAARSCDANLRLWSYRKKYQNRACPVRFDQWGNIGLLNAVERFDVDKGYHFISYAVWWISQAILKAICESPHDPLRSTVQ